MKSQIVIVFCMSVLLTRVLPVEAAPSGALITDGARLFGRFLMLRSRDCQTFYYLAKSYRVDEKQSSVLFMKNSLTDRLDAPTLRFETVLRPLALEPNQAEKELASAWKSGREVECSEKTIRFQPYPSSLQDLKTKSEIKDAGFSDVSATFMADGAKLISFTVDPRKISAQNLLIALKRLKPEEQVQIFSLVTDAKVRITADYEVASTFVQEYFLEKSCTETRECRPFQPCHKKLECTDIPKIMQALKTFDLKSGITFERWASPNSPLDRIDKLEMELMSRFSSSLFMETTRINVGDSIRVTFGTLKKIDAGQYVDEIKSERYEISTLVNTIQIPSLKDYFSQAVNSIYSSTEFKR